MPQSLSLFAPRWSSSVILLALFAAIQCQLVVALPLEIAVETVSVPISTLPQTIGLEVYLAGGIVDASNVVAHQLQLTLNPGGSGIRFIDSGVTERYPYLGPSLAPTSSISGSSLVVSSGDITFGNAFPLSSNAGLVRVEVAVPAGTPLGTYELILSDSSQETFFATEEATLIPRSLGTGQIRVVLPGDYDVDGDVDGNDYLVWQRAFGTVGISDADGNLDGIVGAADYCVWRDNYGAGVGSSPPAMLGVPEPCSINIVSTLVGSLLLRRKRRNT